MKAFYALLFFLVIELASAENATCTACEVVVKFSEYAIKYEGINATELATRLASFCPLFPSIETECMFVTTIFLPELIELLAAGTPPETICAALELCSSNTMKYKPLMNRENKVGKAEASKLIAINLDY